MNPDFSQWNGALLVHKEDGVSSFGVIEKLQNLLRVEFGIKRMDMPKMGHGGTLDPFATGLLPVCVGKGVKLARYFLGAKKEYRGWIRFGETTVPGDPTSPITERSDHLPSSLDEIRAMAHGLTLQSYLQTPPMHSAKKVDGKPLYELARQGIEIEREAKSCQLFEFEITEYTAPRAYFRVICSSGTYIRVLAQDLGRLLGTVAMLDTLERTMTSNLRIENSLKVGEIRSPWNELKAWIPFDRLLDGMSKAQATPEEALALIQGRQNVLFNILRRAEAAAPDAQVGCLAVYCERKLIAVARRENEVWGLERVFTTSEN